MYTMIGVDIDGCLLPQRGPDVYAGIREFIAARLTDPTCRVTALTSRKDALQAALDLAAVGLTLDIQTCSRATPEHKAQWLLDHLAAHPECIGVEFIDDESWFLDPAVKAGIHCYLVNKYGQFEPYTEAA